MKVWFVSYLCRLPQPHLLVGAERQLSRWCLAAVTDTALLLSFHKAGCCRTLEARVWSAATKVRSSD